MENGYLPSYVYRWLRGEVPRAEALLLLARHLKADPAWLVGLDDPPAVTRRRIGTRSTALSPPARRGAAAGVEGLCQAAPALVPPPVGLARRLAHVESRVRRRPWLASAVLST